MITARDLPERLPVFPLSGALLLPRAHLPLHIFEPRYLQMLDDALRSSSRLIGMIQPRDETDPPPLHAVGCAGRINAFSEMHDGRYMITLRGVARFRIVEEIEGFTPYRRCDVSWSDFAHDLGEVESDDRFDRAQFLSLLSRYFEDQDLKTDWDSLSDAEDELLINSLAMLCPFAPEDKQALLEAPSLSERRETLVTLLEFALRGGSTEERLQ